MMMLNFMEVINVRSVVIMPNKLFILLLLLAMSGCSITNNDVDNFVSGAMIGVISGALL